MTTSKFRTNHNMLIRTNESVTFKILLFPLILQYVMTNSTKAINIIESEYKTGVFYYQLQLFPQAPKLKGASF